MAFHTLEVGIQIVSSLQPLVGKIARSDRDLASQLRRAASSIALNVSEGRRREGRDRIHFFRIGAGSAAEVSTALDLAQAWGYVAAEELTIVRELLDREMAMLWRLTHSRAT